MMRLRIGLLAAGIACAAVRTPEAQSAPFKVLVIQGTTSDHTPTSNAAKPVLTKMAADNGFTIDFSSDHSLINDANLAKYQVFLQLNLYPFDLTASERAAFQKFVESGKGWVGVHASGCANNAWPWYSKFMGDITFSGHANLRDGNLIFEDHTHAVTRNMPASMIIKDEWYQFSKSPRPNVKVLAKADEKNYSPYNANGDHPIVWVMPDYKHAVYVSIGHDPGDWQVANYVNLIHDAILWANPAATTRIETGNGNGINLNPAASDRADGYIRLFDAGEWVFGIDGRRYLPAAIPSKKTHP
jgi:type 1 glutamine amidotransferase